MIAVTEGTRIDLVEDRFLPPCLMQGRIQGCRFILFPVDQSQEGLPELFREDLFDSFARPESFSLPDTGFLNTVSGTPSCSRILARMS